MRIGLPRLRDQRGQAMVEFALVMPILFAFLVAAVLLGKGFFFWLDLSHLANTGARMAVVDRWPGCTTGTTPCSDVAPNPAGTKCGADNDGNPGPPITPRQCTLQTYLKQQANTDQLVANSSVDICFVGKNPPDVGVGDTVRLTVRTPYSWFNLLGRTQISYTLRSTTTMRLEQRPQRMSGAIRCPST